MGSSDADPAVSEKPVFYGSPLLSKKVVNYVLKSSNQRKSKNRYAVHWVKRVGLVFYSVCSRKSSQKAAIYGEHGFWKTQNVAFYGERAPG